MNDDGRVTVIVYVVIRLNKIKTKMIKTKDKADKEKEKRMGVKGKEQVK